MSPEEQRLADLLKRTVPEPPRQLTYEEITVPHVRRSRHSWLMPSLAAAAVVVIGVTLGAVAAHHSGPGSASFQPAAGSSSASALPSASPSPTACASGGPQAAVTVPNFVGEQFLVAQTRLRALGFQEMLSVGKAHIEGAPQVVRQSPAAGTKVPPGSGIWLYNYAVGAPGPSPVATSGTAAPTAIPCSSPAAGSPTTDPKTSPTATVVPNVIGQTATQAIAALQAAGFSVTVNVLAQAAPSSGGPVPAGVVWSQTPAAGTALPAGAAITLFYQPKS